jgi:bifunctional UDP-N-acetylglucosamine pyrophosphorylase/glucosamine-1-phosphate N-acetyltransferase
VSDLTVVVLAAGEGTRMRSATPKVLHPLCGRPLVLWPVAAAREAGAQRVIVVDGPKRRLQQHLPDGVDVAVQEQALGTGDAVKAAAGHFQAGVPVVILAGDVPLITGDAIAQLVQAHEDARAAATMATMVLEDPAGYGRVVRAADGTVQAVVETKAAGDATPEQLAIKEVNTGIFCFDGGVLADALDAVTPDNAQGEYYLPDVLPVMRKRGLTVAAHVIEDATLTLGVNDRADLARVRGHAQQRINEGHMRAGVTIVDPLSTSIEAGVTIGQDTILEPGCVIKAGTTIGANAVIGPHTTVLASTVEDGATVRHSYLDGASVGPDVSVGPFAYLRPGARLERGAKAGTFVELKNTTVGEGSKVPHLSYVGDADIGPRTNLGAATITANYDGVNKHRTTIGAGVRTSVDTTLVAPVTVGDGAYTGAGSVITEDVPPDALGIARARQRNVEGYAGRRGAGRDD